MKKSAQGASSKASALITKYFDRHTDWRGPALAKLRTIIVDAQPSLTEEWKWGVPVWSHQGLVCSAAAFKDYVKLDFFKGASIKDPKHHFNAGLTSKAMRAIDFHEGDKMDVGALKALIRAAVAENRSTSDRK
jgi:hypothetical protein